MKRVVIVVAAALYLWPAWPRAFEVDLDTRAIQEAIAIGQSHITGERDRFHAPYRIDVMKAPVDYVDVITPFRRVVLDAQAQAEIGNHTYGQRNALQALAAAPGVLEIDVELTFHPLNTYIGVPDYHVVLAPVDAAGRSVDPLSLDRIPRFGPRVSGTPLPHPHPGGLTVNRQAGPMLGGTVVAQYDARTVDRNARYDVIISEAGTELARVRMALASLR